MDSIAQIDARIVELERSCACEVFQMKARRNALTPFGRLPAELLLIIVGLLVETPQRITKARLMYMLTAVYARLRAVLVAEPSLWTTVTLGSSQALIDQHIARAHPLLLEVSGDVYTEANVQQAIALIPYVSALGLNFHHSEDDEDDDDDDDDDEEQMSPTWAGAVVAALAATDISKLTTLKLEDPHMSDVDLSAVAGVHLSALVLNMYVTGFPALPQLRRLVLRSTYCHVSEVHKLLAGSPRLEHIELENFADNNMSVPVLDRVDLHHLATLKIHDRSSSAILLFGTLPNPSKRLHLRLISTNSADGILTSSAEPLASVLARIAQFWTQLNGEDTTLPLPWIDQDRVRAILSIMSERVSNGWAPREHASLVFIASGCILRHHPLLDEIEVLHISRCKAGDHRFDLGVVKHSRRVMLTGLCRDRAQDTEPLREWIVGQLRRGRPVQSIEFRNCDTTSIRPLFDELLQLQAAQSITWRGLPPWDR
jgi:hypothetical protein